MQIFIKTLTGATIALEVQGTTSVSEIKNRVFAEMGINVEEQVLIYGFSTLEDDESIS